MIHPVFNISQLKPFVANYTAVYSTLPVTTDLEAAAAIPKEIIDRRLVRKGNYAIPQVKVVWTGLPASSATCQHGKITMCYARGFQMLKFGEVSPLTLEGDPGVQDEGGVF
jgi:hypothetical protein